MKLDTPITNFKSRDINAWLQEIDSAHFHPADPVAVPAPRVPAVAEARPAQLVSHISGLDEGFDDSDAVSYATRARYEIPHTNFTRRQAD